MKKNGEMFEQAIKELSDDLITPPGFFSDVDIRNVLDKDIVICNYNEENLTDIGYNLTATEFIFSINNGLLVEIQHNENEQFCFIEPHDTVLVITRESVWVSDKISGTFHSKVKMVSSGFGHVSTTLDPFWEGPLVISINNPTNKLLKFPIKLDKKDGRGFNHCSFVTLIFYKMVTPAKKVHDNSSCRLDILKTIIEKPKEDDKEYYEYDALDNVINNIAELDFVKHNIKELRDPLKRGDGIKAFKQKGNEFDIKIKDYIQEAKSITEKIRKQKQLKQTTNNKFKKWLNILYVLPILYILYIAIKNRSSESVNLGQILPLFLSVYLAFFVQDIKNLYSKKEN